MHVSKKFWFRSIRFGNWFSFRYYWFVWGIFLLSLLGLLYCLSRPLPQSECNESAVLDLIGRLNDQLDYCCNCREPEPAHAGDSLHFNADYLIITYQFTRFGGRDLDTKTEVVSPLRAGPVGFCNRNTSPNTHVIWSGDNTGYGVESCLIDLTTFPSGSMVSIRCASNWYGERKSGKMALDIRAYEGGRMELKEREYQFVNVGGRLTANVTFAAHVGGRGCLNTELVGTVTYDKAAQRLNFIPD
jgi:hypothetical protein